MSFRFSGGFWPSSLPLFHGVAWVPAFVTVSVIRFFVELKELHLDRHRRLHSDLLQTVDS